MLSLNKLLTKEMMKNSKLARLKLSLNTDANKNSEHFTLMTKVGFALFSFFLMQNMFKYT